MTEYLPTYKFGWPLRDTEQNRLVYAHQVWLRWVIASPCRYWRGIMMKWGVGCCGVTWGELARMNRPLIGLEVN